MADTASAPPPADDFVPDAGHDDFVPDTSHPNHPDQSLPPIDPLPVRHVAEYQKEQATEGASQVERGLRQIAGPKLGKYIPGDNDKDLYSDSPTLGPLLDTAKGAANVTLGSLGYLTSWPQAIVHSLAGAIPEQTLAHYGYPTTGKIAGALTDIGASIYAPIPKEIPKFGRDKPVPAPPPEPEFGVNLSEGQATGSEPLIQREQAAKANQSGEAAYNVAKPWFDNQAEQVEAAKDVATSQLSPTGEIVARTPHDAGTVISDTLKEAEAKRSADAAAEAAAVRQQIATDEEKLRPKDLLHPHDAADTVADRLRSSSEALTDAQQQRVAQIERDREGLRGSLNNDGTVIAANPQEASDIISAGVTRAEEQATAVRDAAYEKFESIPGSFRPKAFVNVANDVRRTLNDPKDPFILNNQTPNTAGAIEHLDTDLGAPARIADDPSTQSFAPFTPAKINNIRKNLNARWRAAKNTANATNDYSDLEGMNRVIGSFDDIVDNALKKKRLFDGDGRAISQAWDDANAAHANLRKTFSRQGSGDTVGPVMSKIVGQREGQAMPANAIEQATMNTTGGLPVLMGRRLQDIFGPTSPEIGAVKQGLFSKAVEPAEGVTPYPPERVADNLHKLASSEIGRTHFTPDELARIRQHANDTRAAIPKPAPKTDAVSGAIEKIRGEGGQPMTPEELSGHLFGRDGTGPTPLGEKLTQHVKDTYGETSPEFQAIQRGQISSLTRSPQGAAGFDPQNIAKDIRNFLDNKSAADRLYSSEQQDRLRQYADRLDNHATQSETKLDALDAKNKIASGDSVEKAIARITGRDGGPGASPMEVANMIASRSSPADKATSLGIINRLKQLLPPEKFAAIKQAIFRQTIEPGPRENGANWGSANIVKRITNLKNNAPDLVDAVFSPEDQDMITAFQNMHKKLVVPQTGRQASNHGIFWNKVVKGAAYLIGDAIGATVGAAVGHGVGAVVGAGVGHVTANRLLAAQQGAGAARAIAKQLPIIGQREAEYRKALAAASRQRTPLPQYQTRLALAGTQLTDSLRPLGLDKLMLQGPGTAGAEDQNKNNVPRPIEKQKDGGGVGGGPQTRAHGGIVGDSAPAKPKTHPVITGATLAPDGYYYLKDPNRPGKFLKVIERGRQHAAA